MQKRPANLILVSTLCVFGGVFGAGSLAYQLTAGAGFGVYAATLTLTAFAFATAFVSAAEALLVLFDEGTARLEKAARRVGRVVPGGAELPRDDRICVR